MAEPDKIAFVADVHLGNHKRQGGEVTVGLNRRCRAAVAAFATSVKYAIEAGCGGFVVVGDLFDDDHPSPQLITEVRAILADANASAGLHFALVEGNHEQRTVAPGDHALGPFGDLAVIVDRPQVVTFLRGQAAVACVPFSPGEAALWFPNAIAALRAELHDHFEGLPTALALHLGIKDEQTAPWLLGSHDAITAVALFAELAHLGTRARQAFAGNWHERQTWRSSQTDRAIHQLGALVPTGWDNQGVDYGRMAVWTPSTGLVGYAKVPGPRFFQACSLEELAFDMGTSPAGNQHYARLVVAPSELSETREALTKLAAAGKLVAWEVVPDVAEAKAAVRTAAGAARAAASLGAGLAAYVEAFPLAEGVDRAAVLRRASAFLELAQ